VSQPLQCPSVPSQSLTLLSLPSHHCSPSPGCKYPAHKNCKKKAGKSCRPGWDMQHTKKPPVAVGDKAPLFILNDGNGMPYSLKHSIAMKKKVIIFFYPKGE